MSDWADEKAKVFADAVCDNWEVMRLTQNWSMCRQSAAAALRQARNDALEEALRFTAPEPGEAWSVEERALGERIASAIRFLKDKA